MQMQPERSELEKPSADLRPKRVELSGTTPDETATEAPAAELDPDSLAAIRELMTQTEAVEPTPAAEAAASVAAAPVAAAAPAQPAARARRKADALPPIAPQAPAAQAAAEPQARAKPTRARADTGGGLIARAKARVTGYRPTPRHIVIAAAVLFVLMRPWLVLGLVFFTIFLITGLFLIMGYDGFWKRAMGIGRWYARRRPERSAELHRKLDDFAVKWDGILDRFPEGSVDGLYLPDFGDFAQADARHEAAMERRLDSLRESDARA